MKNTILAAVSIALSSLLTPVFADEVSPEQTLAIQPSATAIAELPPAPTGKRFNLTDDQLEKLNSLKLQYKAATAGKKAQLEVLRGQLRDAMTQPTVDKGALLGLQGQINSLQADLANSRIGLMADSSAVFTPEQRQQFRHFALSRHGGRGHHRGGFGGGCGRPHGMKGPGGPGPGRQA